MHEDRNPYSWTSMIKSKRSLEVRFYNIISITKVPSQRKSSPNCCKFTKQIRCDTTNTREVVNPSSKIIPQNASKACNIWDSERRTININLDVSSRRRVHCHLIRHVVILVLTLNTNPKNDKRKYY